MGIHCLCDKYHKLRIRGQAKLKAAVIGRRSVRECLRAESKIKASATIRPAAKARVCGIGGIRGFTNSDMDIQEFHCQDNAKIKGNATFPFLCIRSKARSESKIRISHVEKFAGHIARLNRLENFSAQQKLFPSGDVSSVNIINQDLSTSDLFDSINEGVFTGNYTKSGKVSTLQSDDNASYIQPSSIATNGSFAYECDVNPALIKTKESFLFLRAAVPLKNYGSNTSPKVTISNINLTDPSGNLVVKYKDLVFRGDAEYDSEALKDNYTTYISEPEINKGKLHEWQEGHTVYQDSTGYRLSLNIDIECLDDPFDSGFNVGYEEYVCDVTGGPFVVPTHNLRISAIEICNSGHPRSNLPFGSLSENYLGLTSEVQPTGQRIIKHIFPTVVMPYDFDTTIYPQVNTTWESNPYPDPEDAISNLSQRLASGIALASKISDRSLSTYISLTETTIEGSGKLIAKFEDRRQAETSFFIGRDYSGQFGLSYDRSRYISTPIDDAFYSNISKVELVIKAKKDSPSIPDYALDVVGYSDDKILFVSEPQGGFLQNIEGGTVVTPNVVSSSVLDPDMAIASEAISDQDETVVYTDSIANSGGDHYILTQTPVIDNVLFREYRIPLKIYNIEPELGRTQKFDNSRYFEHLYLDIYPLPSGAEIADMYLSVEYSPQNAIILHTLGCISDHPFQTSNMPLRIVPDDPYDDAVTHNFSNDTIPHGYDLYTEDGFRIPDNMARRWRGVSGKYDISDFNYDFDFSFFREFTSTPFSSGYYDFTRYNDDCVLDSNDKNVSGVFVGVSTNDIYKNVGWRFSSDLIFANQELNYRTIDWHNFGFHPQFFNIRDAFDSAIRVSGVAKHVNFGNIDFSNGLSAFVRFSPDEIIDTVNNMFEDGVILAKYNAGQDLEFSIGYQGGYLTASCSDVNGNIITITEPDYSPVFWSFPLSVLLTYDTSDNILRLYADNERQLPWDVPILRASSSPFVKKNTSQDVTLGYSSGSGIGCAAFVSEVGLSDTIIDAEDLFASIRKTDAYKDINKLWDYLDSDIANSWKLGEFRHCQFNQDFSRLSQRADSDYIEHHLIHDGLPYSSRTDVPFPQTLNASGLAYHTQIENDFLRFHIEDVPSSSGEFYVASERITKNLPRGYKFAEEAITVETVVQHETVNDIVWDDGKIGPKLIVSLYSPRLVPSYDGADKSLGLINRHIHYIGPNDCIHKLNSTFDYNNLIDESEEWSLFNRDKEHIIKEFDHKYYSPDINDMFLQYDLVYPSGASIDSRIKLHAAHIRLKDCLRFIPDINNTFNLYVSGQFIEREILPIHSIGSDIIESSGLTLYASGAIPESVSEQMGLFVSGVPVTESALNLFCVNAYQSIDNLSDGLFGEGLYGSGPIGFKLFVEGGGITELMNLSTFNDETVPKFSGVLTLSTINNTLQKKPLNDALNITVFANPFDSVGSLSEASMNLVSYLSNVFPAVTDPLNLTCYYEEIPPNSEQDTLNLYVINYPAFNPALTQQQVILWDGANVGTNILVTDNEYSSLAADDEIRGVITTCFGDCATSELCTNVEVITHGVNWGTNSCHNGGILRGSNVYTNLDVGYDRAFYGIRKYVGLLPSYPYNVIFRGYSGSNEPVDLPRMIENIEYGSNDEVDFSGIKMYTDDPLALHARYGKDIVTKGDLMAIGAPDYTLQEGTKQLDDSGAVFLYRRNPAPSGYDWTNQDDKAGWSLEQVLTLPSGFQRDYYTFTNKEIGGQSFYARQWYIGNYGRKFGTSVDIAIDETTGKEIVLVGAPNGIFDREFIEITPEPIRVAVFVVTDEFNGYDGRVDEAQNRKPAWQLLKEQIQSRNEYFELFSNPSFIVNVDLFIIEPNKNIASAPFVEYSNPTNFIHRVRVNRLVKGEDPAVAGLVIQQQIQEAFDSVYPIDVSKRNNNQPVCIGVFIDESASCGVKVVPGLDTFLENYESSSFVNGVTTWDQVPASGVVFEDIPYERQNLEDWYSFSETALEYTLGDNAISDNLDLFASGYGILYAADDSRFNIPPHSGGRAYLFEREPFNSGLFTDTDSMIWNVTQQFSYDFGNNGERNSFGFSVAMSDNLETIAIGSPFHPTVGVTVFEINSLSNDPLFADFESWLISVVEERQLSGQSIAIYQSIYDMFLYYKSIGFSSAGAASKVYYELDDTNRFDLMTFVNNQKYKQHLQQKSGYEMQGTYPWYPENFASNPRVGYSVDLNEDGTILAIGCPTDSMNMWDDTNVWYRNTPACPEEKNYAGQTPAGGYQSPYDSEAHLQTSYITTADHPGTWSSYVNAGAVRVFSGRKYFPHNKVVEYGIFGNAHELYNQPENVANDVRSFEYNIVSGIFNSNGIPFVKTNFDDPEIPQDAGLLFIMSPVKDSLSEEVLENIVQWMSYGDRNLVLVGDDPVYEADGFYDETNRIINTLLDKLDSRIRLFPARNEKYAALTSDIPHNVVPARVPEGSIEHNVSQVYLKASGVADIRLYDPSIEYHHHGCTTQADEEEQLQLLAQILTPAEFQQFVADQENQERRTYDTANYGCEQPIQHLGDLRAQWYEWCAKNRENTIFVRTPRNIPAAYGKIPGLTPPLCNKGEPCYVDPKTCTGWVAQNLDVPPVPLLAIGEKPPTFSYIQKGTPDSVGSELSGVVPDPTNVTLSLGQPQPNAIFNWDAVPGSSEYVGNYNEYPTFSWPEGQNLFSEGGQFFKPEDTDRAFIAQSRNLTMQEPIFENVLAEEWINIVAEQEFEDELSSSIVLVASTLSESQDVLQSSLNDTAILFYRNLLTKQDQVFDTEKMFDLEPDNVRVAQLGGWTQRASLRDGYSKSNIYYENAGGKHGLVELNSLFFHVTNFDENITSQELLNGRAGKSYSDYDICWIANTKHPASDEDIQTIRTWLKRGNKKLIITYGHDADIENGNDQIPSTIVADNVADICSRLGVDMKPLYLNGLGRYAEYGRDNFGLPEDFNPPNQTFIPDFNQESYLSYITNSSRLSNFTLWKDNPRVLRDSTTEETLFIPIDLNGAKRVASLVGYTGQGKTNRVRDQIITSITNHYNNAGFIKVSFDVPTQSSGYYFEFGFFTQNPLERNGQIDIFFNNVNESPITAPEKEKVKHSLFGYDNLLNPVPLFEEVYAYRTEKALTLQKQTVKAGPFYAYGDRIDIYISTNDIFPRELAPGNPVPYSAKLGWVSGYPVPQVTTIGSRKVFRDVVIPGTPDKEIFFTPPIQELGSPHTRYCPSEECEPAFEVPLNERGGKTREEWQARFLAGEGIKTADGPVVTAQEIEIFSSFKYGVNRSRVTVISDASILQGSGALTSQGGIPFELYEFVTSLYPFTEFPVATNGKSYDQKYKILCPERGSPYKWYSAYGDEDLISRFNPNNNVIPRLPMNKFTDVESEYDPLYVHRPKYVWECEDAPPIEDTELLIKQMVDQFREERHVSFSSQFSGIVDGKGYVDDLELYKDKGYDFLDFNEFDQGYPGDLFGYSVKLVGEKLFVGAPFSAFHQEGKTIRWSEISNTTINETPSGVTLSAYGGAGAVYMFENTGNGISPIRSGETNWEYIRKFRPDSINVGQDYADAAEASGAAQLGNHQYSDHDVRHLSKYTDRFGWSTDLSNGVLVIGAPGHDFGNFATVEPSTFEFMNKAFGNGFDIPKRTVHDLGTSGVRLQFPNSGTPVFNNGAVYAYSEDFDFLEDKLYWRQLEKIVPQGNKDFYQNGSEGSHFGNSVSIDRRYRTDADYTIAVGSPEHPYTSGNNYLVHQGAGYTYDIMLRKQLPAQADPNTYMNARLFGHSGVVYNNLIKNELILDITNNNDNSKEYNLSGVIYTTPRGEIFVEYSGQDFSQYNFIQHIPFAESVNGQIRSGPIWTNAIRLTTEGRPDEASGNMPLTIIAADSANVYNQVGLYNFGVTDIVYDSGLALYSNGETPYTISSSGLSLFASGVGTSYDSLTFRTRGF